MSLQQISQTLGVGERAVAAGLTGGLYSLLVEGQGVTTSLIEAGVVTAADVMGQGLRGLVPVGLNSSWDIPGALATGVVYGVGTRVVGYGGPFNSLVGNALYAIGCDAVGQTLASVPNDIISAASSAVHHNSHNHV